MEFITHEGGGGIDSSVLPTIKAGGPKKSLNYQSKFNYCKFVIIVNRLNASTSTFFNIRLY